LIAKIYLTGFIVLMYELNHLMYEYIHLNDHGMTDFTRFLLNVRLYLLKQEVK